MYEFIDVNQTSGGMSLPSEALQINGEYIENLITGYRTLTVEGREALSPELDTYETGIRDGATLKNKKYPPRTIRVTYQIISSSNTAFRNAYNELARILDVKDARLIFADEQDKFFTGTPSYIGEVTPGRNSVVGEFEILCTDPFKYSLEEREVTPVLDSKSILLDYGGTYRAFPKLVAEFYKENEASEDGETVTTLTGAGDCGYVAFFNENEKIIQLGDPEEIDTEEVPVPSQTLVNSVFETDKSWGSAAKSQWSINSGLASSNDVQQVGSLHMAPRYWRTVPYKLNGDIILDVWSKAGAPYIHYLVGMQGVRTSATTAKLTISVKANLEHSSSYFRKPYALRGEVKIDLSDGTKTLTFWIKNADEIWEGTTAHLKTFSIDAKVGADEYITGIWFKAHRMDFLGNTGELSQTKCDDFWIGPDDGNKEPLYYHLTPVNYGSGAKWHGPSITRRLPADSSGEVGAKNFRLSFFPKMSMEFGRYGALQCLVVSGSGASRKILAGISLYHNSNGNKYLRLYVNGAVKETIQLANDAVGYLSGGVGSSIVRTGNFVTFNVAGIRRVYYDDRIADTVAHEITFTFLIHGSYPMPPEFNGLSKVTFIKDYSDLIRDIPNKFSANDVVEADCNTGEIFLNGARAPEYGALGNDWEGFYLKPGINEVGFSYSDWVSPEYAPKFKLKYREVFL